MAQGKSDAPASTPPKTGTSLADIAAGALKTAEAVQPRQRIGNVVSGPFPVGGMGEVSVIEREQGDAKYLFAEFQPASGAKPKSIPLAAVAALAGELA